MTSPPLARFFMQRPFEPFTMVLADGRELHVNHPEFADVNAQDEVVTFQHPSGQLEVIDPRLIVSIRTIYPAHIGDYRKRNPSE
jgi:hypothetical protein